MDLGLRIAMDFVKARQPLAAAIVYSDLARGGVSSAELWCGLGSALMMSRGRLVRKPFEDWAAKVLRRGSPLVAGTPYNDPVSEWLKELPDAARTAPLTDAEIPELIEFLLVNERVLPDAVAALGPEAAMTAVMILGDRKDPMYVSLLRDAVQGKLGDGAARSALKRIAAFRDRSDMQASLLAVTNSPMRESLEPYLSFVTNQLPPGWDGPRTSVCPPYEGIGQINVELVSVGPNPTGVLEALCECLGAIPRDARSWVDCAPCIVKRGVTRADALGLTSALEKLGAKVTMHGFTWSHDVAKKASAPGATSDSVKKPWWKFW